MWNEVDDVSLYKGLCIGDDAAFHCNYYDNVFNLLKLFACCRIVIHTVIVISAWFHSPCILQH